MDYLLNFCRSTRKTSYIKFIWCRNITFSDEIKSYFTEGNCDVFAYRIIDVLILFRKSHRRCSLRKCVLRNFAKFTGKHQCLFFNKVAGLWATVSIFLLFNGLFVVALVKRHWLKYLDLIYANNDSNPIEKIILKIATCLDFFLSFHFSLDKETLLHMAAFMSLCHWPQKFLTEG